VGQTIVLRRLLAPQGQRDVAEVQVCTAGDRGDVRIEVEGIRPRNWWEAERAKRATRRALALWLALLVLLTLIVALTSRWKP
jgi:cell division septal protein FtsQ